MALATNENRNKHRLIEIIGGQCTWTTSIHKNAQLEIFLCSKSSFRLPIYILRNTQHVIRTIVSFHHFPSIHSCINQVLLLGVILGIFVASLPFTLSVRCSSLVELLQDLLWDTI